MKFRLLAVIAMLPAICVAQTIDKNDNPGSLWTPSTVNPFLDRTARRVGDLVTIVISEQSAATFTAATNMKKSDSNKLNLDLFCSFLNNILKPASSGATSSNDGSGTTTQNGKLSARITGVIKEVMPNGVMVVEATRSLVINKELQSFKLRGLVRRDDVSPDNTVMSEALAEADIRFEGKGAIQDRQRRGLLTQVMDWLF
ncbi:MAG: flagellar basal body L-ring protein FlgH [Gammaproteobacteria bacterium]|nr:flagellar basal body L-ring protein FlgH [Gammaproteobacteria bacterium]